MIMSLYDLLYKYNEKKWKLFLYRVIKLYLNIIYPVYVIFSKNYKSKKLANDVIVSLTSFPGRIDKLWIVIETLLRQTYKPEKIILWLAESQFDSVTDLPLKLQRQVKRGLEIRFCEDLKSHKKYYYTMVNYPNNIVITVDDDTFYPENLVENLFLTSRKFPKSICCNLGHTMTFNSDGQIAPYNNWSFGANDSKTPSDFLVPIGCEGILYPPKSLNKNVFDKIQIKELCPLADDLWLKAMATLNGTKAVKVNPVSIPYVNLSTSKRSSLNIINVDQFGNDDQLKKIITAYPELEKKWNKRYINS